MIRKEYGKIPYVILRLAGVYDERSTVPTMAHQMARIYERDFKSHLYSGDTLVGQSMLHRDDLLEAIRRAVERRATLPEATELLIGEPDAMGYDALQDEFGRLFHGADDWKTLRVPKPFAAAGAWAQQKLEPVVPDAIDEGNEPFIKPFMVRLADDHYALDVRRARELLGWEPRHRLKDDLPKMVRAVKDDPAVYGQEIVFTVTVAVQEPGAGTPTGKVYLKEGDTVLGEGTLDEDGAATITLQASADLTAGSHSLLVVYEGDDRFDTSTTPGAWAQ